MSPGGQTPLWDVHVHLPAYEHPMAMVSDATRRGMRLVSVTVSPGEVAPSLSLRDASLSAMKCFIGVHPSEAAATPRALEELSWAWDSADGVGEVGLDPKYSEVSPGSAQMRLFEGQVGVAESLGKPLQVHSRGAEEACLDVLDSHSPGPLLMHWFEREDLIDKVVSRRRTFVSFGPALLYSKKLARCVKRCPPEAVLVESDGPVPFAALGGASGPGLVPSVAFKLAELWGIAFDEAVQRLALNAERYLGPSSAGAPVASRG